MLQHLEGQWCLGQFTRSQSIFRLLFGFGGSGLVRVLWHLEEQGCLEHYLLAGWLACLLACFFSGLADQECGAGASARLTPRAPDSSLDGKQLVGHQGRNSQVRIRLRHPYV